MISYNRDAYWWVADLPFPMPCSFIYGLVDASGTIRYVGMASNPISRLRQHRGGVARVGTFWWATGTAWEFDKPRMVILEACSRADARSREAFWMRALDKRTPGGLMNNDMPGERRRKSRFMRPDDPVVACFNCARPINGRGGSGGINRSDIAKWSCLRSACVKAGDARAKQMRVGIYA